MPGIREGNVQTCRASATHVATGHMVHACRSSSVCSFAGSLLACFPYLSLLDPPVVPLLALHRATVRIPWFAPAPLFFFDSLRHSLSRPWLCEVLRCSLPDANAWNLERPPLLLGTARLFLKEELDATMPSPRPSKTTDSFRLYPYLMWAEETVQALGALSQAAFPGSPHQLSPPRSRRLH